MELIKTGKGFNSCKASTASGVVFSVLGDFVTRAWEQAVGLGEGSLELLRGGSWWEVHHMTSIVSFDLCVLSLSVTSLEGWQP